jgi:hypothetical protein
MPQEQTQFLGHLVVAVVEHINSMEILVVLVVVAEIKEQVV